MFEQLSIYIHVPFCVKKCAYCDFFSSTDNSLIPDYYESLIKEIQYRNQTWAKVQTLYFGGGTPSLLNAEHVEKIIETVDESFILSGDTEITMEVNPATVDKAKLSAFKAFGVNRLSIGVQSFDDEKLSFLGRAHDAGQAVETIENAKTAGFKNISIDLIYGLGFEDRERWQKDLDKAVKISPSHMSCYMLTIEPETPLYKNIEQGKNNPLPRPDMLNMFKQTSLFLEENGYEHYEISNFAKGRENRSQHNSHYWSGNPYLGFGPGAHSYDNATRSWNNTDTENYIKKLNSGTFPVQESETLTQEQKISELILLRLRTIEGVDIAEFENEFNISFTEKFSSQIDAVCKEDFGFIKNGRFALTLEGRVRLDSIVETFTDELSDPEN